MFGKPIMPSRFSNDAKDNHIDIRWRTKRFLRMICYMLLSYKAMQEYSFHQSNRFRFYLYKELFVGLITHWWTDHPPYASTRRLYVSLSYICNLMFARVVNNTGEFTSLWWLLYTCGDTLWTSCSSCSYVRCSSIDSHNAKE